MIICSPQGGVGNRMQVINSYYKVAKYYNQKLVVIWKISGDLCCSSKKLFNMPEEVGLFEIRLGGGKTSSLIFKLIRNILRIFPTVDHLDEYNYIDKELDSEEMTIFSKGIVFCDEVCESLTSSYEFENICIPNQAVEKEVNNIIGNKTDCVGIHIRRTDFRIDKPGIVDKYSDLYFETIIEEEMKNGTRTIFIACDEADVKRRLLDKYPNFCISQNITCFERNQENGIIEGFIDLISLSKCKRIYGTKESSFSKMAALIGKSEYII